MLKFCLSLPFALLALAGPLNACPVPVYYYALFEWPSDPHALSVGSLPAKGDAGLVTDFIGHNPANIINTEDKSHAVPPGHVQISFPQSKQVWWDGPLPDADPKKGLSLLVDSPVRQALVKQLASGESAVWLFVDSGDKKADDKAFDLLAHRLKYLQKITQLPPVTDGNNGELDRPEFVNAPVRPKIAFSILRLNRKDPREVGLVAQLLHLEPELAQAKGPMAFAVIGRARVVSPLYGQNFTESNIDATTSFVVGSCSCEVKDMNVGADLLVSADWEKIFDSERAAQAPTRPSPQHEVTSAPEEATIQPKSP